MKSKTLFKFDLEDTGYKHRTPRCIVKQRPKVESNKRPAYSRKDKHKDDYTNY